MLLLIPFSIRCLCDDGYAGYDCTERVCPTGDDPGTWGQDNEVQLITLSTSLFLVHIGALRQCCVLANGLCFEPHSRGSMQSSRQVRINAQQDAHLCRYRRKCSLGVRLQVCKFHGNEICAHECMKSCYGLRNICYLLPSKLTSSSVA